MRIGRIVEEKDMETKIKKSLVIVAGCACGTVSPIIAGVTKNPAYGLFGCVAAAAACGLAIGIHSIRNR